MDLDELVKATARPPAMIALEGEVHATPGGADELVTVRVPSIDRKTSVFQQVRWVGATTPTAGDSCLLVQAQNTQMWWALVWPGTYTQPD